MAISPVGALFKTADCFSLPETAIMPADMTSSIPRRFELSVVSPASVRACRSVQLQLQFQCDKASRLLSFSPGNTLPYPRSSRRSELASGSPRHKFDKLPNTCSLPSVSVSARARYAATNIQVAAIPTTGVLLGMTLLNSLRFRDVLMAANLRPHDTQNYSLDTLLKANTHEELPALPARAPAPTPIDRWHLFLPRVLHVRNHSRRSRSQQACYLGDGAGEEGLNGGKAGVKGGAALGMCDQREE